MMQKSKDLARRTARSALNNRHCVHRKVSDVHIIAYNVYHVHIVHNAYILYSVYIVHNVYTAVHNAYFECVHRMHCTFCEHRFIHQTTPEHGFRQNPETDPLQIMFHACFVL